MGWRFALRWKGIDSVWEYVKLVNLAELEIFLFSSNKVEDIGRIRIHLACVGIALGFLPYASHFR